MFNNMPRSPFRLHTRACGLEKPIVSLDITRNDFHISPLELYVTHWFIAVDDFIDYLTKNVDISVDVIVSNLLADMGIDVLCPFLLQISKVYILGPYLKIGHIDKYVNQRFLDIDSLLNVLVYNVSSNIITHKCYSIERSANNLTTNSAQHIWYQFFFDLLLHLTPTSVAQEEMFQAVQAFHEVCVKDHVSRNCRDFKENYKAADILSWYTRTSFFYAALNRALRFENINYMFVFRYVISDLNRSLRELQMQQPPSEYQILYRGQQMYVDELKSIVSNIGNLIEITTFWSVTPSFESSPEMSQYQYAAYRYSSVRMSYTRRIRYQTIIDVVPACQYSTISTTLFEKLRWFGLAYPFRYATPR